MNLPNSITLARLALTAVYVLMASLSGAGAAWISLGAFVIAAATDWLDGYLARKMNLVTALGKLLDPLVDKILVCAAFVHLSMESMCPMWMTILIIGREFLVTGLRQIAVERGVVIAADRWGKAKTIAQMIAVIAKTIAQMIAVIIALLLLAGRHGSSEFFWASWLSALLPIILWLAVFLTCLSGWNYLRAARPLFARSE
ncbi:MAG: CDP-diacylglycerol--glycerol-3-phosphate 3-phosphatidyltransferase [Verrucomicrobia bacterium]|nr:MAG: CDP-diacylglycerol--glycerol-3-phosphate 3-phosphatidyltransferase [Verrucomicrobiota bacterium]